MGSGDMLVIAPRGQEQIIACGKPHPSCLNRGNNCGCRRTDDSHFMFSSKKHEFISSSPAHTQPGKNSRKEETAFMKTKTVPQTRKIRCRRGMSLVDATIAIAILLIALLGTFILRYSAALDGRRANAQTTAARIALMLCESWRGVNGDETYDPAAHLSSDFNVSEGAGPAKPDDFTLLGSYTVAFDSETGVNNYMTTLSWKDIQSGLRALNVVVAWASREHLEWATQQIDGVSVDKSFELTVYTQTY